MADTGLIPGRTVLPMDGENEIWPTLAVAAIETTVEDADGQQWTRYGAWWSGADGARLTSVQLAFRGPLTVISVHEHQEWIDISEFGKVTVTSMCASCGFTKETPR